MVEKYFNGKIEKVGTADKVLSIDEVKAAYELLEREDIEGFNSVNNKLYVFTKEKKET